MSLLSAGLEKNDVVVLHNLLISQALLFAYGCSRLSSWLFYDASRKVTVQCEDREENDDGRRTSFNRTTE